MDRDRLTAKRVYAAKPPASGQAMLWDSEVAGFGLRVTAGGAKSFILNYQFADPGDRRKSSQYRYTIGPARTTPRGVGWSVDEARKEANRWAKRIDSGDSHPLAERRGRDDAVKAARGAETFDAALSDYIEQEQRGRKGNATAGEVDRAIRKDCADWLERPIAAVNAVEIGALLRQLRDGKGKVPPKRYMANRLFAYLRTFLAWCANPDVAKIPASPMVGVRRPWDGEEVRDRVYSDAELKAIWRAADEIGDVSGAYIKALLLTGKRSGAMGAMQWAEIGEDGIWIPPVDLRRRKRTKRVHAIPLPKLMQRVIAPLKPRADQDASPYVFPGRKRGAHLYPSSDLAERVKSSVDGFFFHALRHTVETRLAELRVPPHIRDLVLDHAPARGAGAGYDHFHYREEMAAALELWASHVESVVAPGAQVLR